MTELAAIISNETIQSSKKNEMSVFEGVGLHAKLHFQLHLAKMRMFCYSSSFANIFKVQFVLLKDATAIQSYNSMK